MEDLPIFQLGKAEIGTSPEELGLPEISLHCFRHSHSTQLNALGTDSKTLQTQLRHANPEITMGRLHAASSGVPEGCRAAVGGNTVPEVRDSAVVLKRSQLGSGP
jgi:hypothetical protein